jgi:uncharacterized protein YndB with AHSA1/START domain
MPYTYVLTATIPASPDEVFATWLDSRGHSTMTGGEATMSDEVGATVSAWDGYITGRNLELVPGQRIVQSWRTSQFDDAHEDSVITVLLQAIDDGTLLTLEHKNVPDDQRSYEEGGWQSNYFEPMVAYFTKRKQEAGSPAPQKAAAKRTAKASRPKSKRAKSNRPKSTRPKTKQTRSNKKKSQVSRGKVAKPKRQPAKSRTRKSRRGKR